MAENSNSSSGGVGCFTLLGLIFITLKLTGHITWSWVWVLAPFWIGFVILLVVMVLALLMVWANSK